MNLQTYWVHEIIPILHYFTRFIKNPITEIRRLPHWDWKNLFLLQICIAIISGALFGIISQSWRDFFSGIILLPIATLFSVSITTMFFYYTFLFLHHTALPLRQLFTLILLATFPYYLIHPLAGLLSPLDLLGFALSGMLLIVGLVDNFDLPRKLVIRIIAIIYVLFFIIWAVSRVAAVHEQRGIRERINTLGSSQLY